jgi:hypothetical protein
MEISGQLQQLQNFSLLCVVSRFKRVQLSLPLQKNKVFVITFVVTSWRRSFFQFRERAGFDLGFVCFQKNTYNPRGHVIVGALTRKEFLPK